MSRLPSAAVTAVADRRASARGRRMRWLLGRWRQLVKALVRRATASPVA
jgi:hypothetical protein